MIIVQAQLVLLQMKVQLALSGFADGKLWYIVQTEVFKKYNKTAGLLELTTDYPAYVGRDKLKIPIMYILLMMIQE